MPHIIFPAHSTRHSCFIVTVIPATVSVPFLLAPVLLGLNEYVTIPDPLPEAPELIVIHATLLTADQAHPLVVDTLIVPVPPALATNFVSGETKNEQSGCAPA